ncbi:DUF305 domain-containing protein [Spirosoma spitsbergense]|uniref:DUF305 domain-containing protein n=1 Tax=Spirosoma spitsbergense TaxID=431554 RepID=UPI00036DF4ED|nr:DUF305 domain-containing protein [Spirosoma spitsbergense]
MKTLQFNVSIWALALLTASSSLAACAQTRRSVQFSSARVSNATVVDSSRIKLLMPLQQTVTKLKKLSATGDPDFDYSFQAKLQAQGLQDFLKQEIENGKDSSLQQMAKQLLETTTADIATIDATMRQLKPTRPNQTFTQQQGQNIEAMNLKLQKTTSNDTLSKDFDSNFATLLMDQRQDSIDMATTYLQYGKNDTLRAYAQQLVDQSKKQMNTLKTMTKTTVK